MTGFRLTALGRASVVAAVLAALAPGVAQAGTWLSPRNLDSTNGSGLSVGLDAVGNAFAAWQTNPGGTTPDIIEGDYRPIGAGLFSALPDISTDNTTPMHNNFSPVVVTNASGNGLVVWVNDQSGGEQQIQLRTIAPGGIVGPVLTVPAVLVPASYANPTAAINDNGDAVVAWDHGPAIEAITRQGLSGAFANTTTPDVLDATAATPPSVAIDGAGNSIAVWKAVGATIAAKRHPAGGAWSAIPDTVSVGADALTAPVVKANANGQMVVVFNDTTTTTADAVSGTVTAGWGVTPVVATLSATGVTQGPVLNVADDGGAIAAWARGSAVEYSVRAAGGAFPGSAGAQEIAPVPAAPDNIALSGDGRGDAVVAWSTFEVPPTQNVVRAAVRPAGGAFGATTLISDPTEYAGAPSTISLDQQGDALVGWQIGATTIGVGFAEYEAGPALGTPSIPATATVGQTVGFSVPAPPTEAFTSAASTTWNFGDGSAAAGGTAVSHAFGRAGTFTVSVTATDSLGNTATRTGTIVINPAPVTPPNCKVPTLITDTLSQATKALTAAHCKLGTARAPKPKEGHKLGPLAVISSSPGAGTVHPNGTKVNLALGQLLTPGGNALGLRVVHGCVDRRRFAYPVREPRAYGRVVTALIFVNGKLVKTVKGHSLLTVALTKLPIGHFKVTVRALTTKNLVLVYNRTYSGCKTSKRTGSKHKGK